MKKMFMAVLACLALALPLAGVGEAANASPSAYTFLERISRGNLGAAIQIHCHSGQDPYMGVNQGSVTVGCGYNGWVDGGTAFGCNLKVQNWNTGNITTYPRWYNGSIGGGYYDVWATC